MMSTSPILIDLTELLGNPIRTGIQRVEREIIRNWPGQLPLQPCRFDAASGGFVTVSDSVFYVLGSQTTHPGEAERQLLQPRLQQSRRLSVAELSQRLFNPEVFYDAARAAAYRSICSDPSNRVSWLLFDFLPYLRPQDYPPTTSRSCMHYLYAMTAVRRVCSISQLTQQQFSSRIMRDPARTGPFFPLGGDGLEMEKQQFSVARTGFSYIGTIEPRKNVAIVLEAFELLWARGVDVPLTIVERLDVRSSRERAMLSRLADEPRLNYLGHVDDATVRDVIRNTRATLFLSAAEGFGIPPLESLSVGVPAIVSAGLPSTDALPPGGRLTIADVTAVNVAAAVESLVNDDTAARLWDEAAQLRIPSWRDFTRNVADWLESE
jgi:glycosyltransferase involved in cell wall biosynthesis